MGEGQALALYFSSQINAGAGTTVHRPYCLAALAPQPPRMKKSGASPEGEDVNPSLANNHQERNFPGPQVHNDQSSLGPTLRGSAGGA
jgi:hypothetical protein